MNKIKGNRHLFFFFKLTQVLAIILLLDFAIGKTLRYFYFKQNIGRQYRATYTIENTTDSILIFGSSKAYSNYVPEIFEKKLNISCYNSGSPGQFILYDYAVLKAVLKRYSPKHIFLDLIPGELAKEDKGYYFTYERLSFLLPFYKKHPEMRPVLDLKSPFEKYKLASSIYPFNSKTIYIAASNAGFLDNSNATTKGWQPLSGEWTGLPEFANPTTNDLDSTKLFTYRSFLQDCRKAGVKVFVVCSPNYEILQSKDSSTEAAKSIAEEEGMEFFDFTNDSFFLQNPHLFAKDPYHLNKDGAEIFTSSLLDSIAQRF